MTIYPAPTQPEPESKADRSPSSAPTSREREILESIGDAFYALDRDWRFIYVNGRAGELWGRDPDDLLGRRVWDEFPEAVGSEPYRMHVLALEGNKRVEFPALSPVLGRWIEISIYPSAFGLSVYFRDITQRRQLEEEKALLHDEAERNRQFLAAVFDQMPSGVIIGEAPSGRVLMANERVSQIWRRANHDAADISGYGKSEGFHADGTRYAPEEWPLARSVTSGEVVENEQIKILRGDGTRGFINVSSKPLCDAAGEIVAGVVVFQDITERKRVEAELAASEQRWQWLADSMPVHVTLAAPDGAITYLNRRWLDFTGAPPEEGLGYGWTRFIHHDDLPALSEEYVQAVQDVRPLEMEFRVRRASGEYCWFLGRMIALQEEGAGALKWISVSIDITERKQAEDERERLLYELDRANAAKDEFLGNVSHELKSPITTILGNAEILLHKLATLNADVVLLALADIQHDAERLHRIIEDLLTLARIQGGSSPEMEPLLVAHVIERVVEEHRQRFRHRRVEVLAEGGAIAYGDPLYVEQIIRNLLSNAEKYSDPTTPIRVTVSKGAREVVVRVVDSGAGLTSDEMTMIFAPFFRVPRLSAGAPGLGVGLAVCKRLVEAQRGRIWVSARREGGSEFGFSLPTDEEGADAQQHEPQIVDA